MFPTIASCSTMRIGPYLFYIEKFIIQLKTTEKNYNSSVDIHFWMSDDVTSNGVWGPQRRISIYIVFVALSF